MVPDPIMIVFNLTRNDIMANRDGYATPKQVQGKSHSIVDEIIKIVMLGVPFIAVIVNSCWIFLSILDGETPFDLFTIFIICLGILSIIILGYFIPLLLEEVKKKLQERRLRIVHCVSGSIRLQEREFSDEPSIYLLHIDSEQLCITREQYNVLVAYQNSNWHVHYFPHTKNVASLESY